MDIVPKGEEGRAVVRVEFPLSELSVGELGDAGRHPLDDVVRGHLFRVDEDVLPLEVGDRHEVGQHPALFALRASVEDHVVVFLTAHGFGLEDGPGPGHAAGIDAGFAEEVLLDDAVHPALEGHVGFLVYAELEDQIDAGLHVGGGFEGVDFAHLRQVGRDLAQLEHDALAA